MQAYYTTAPLTEFESNNSFFVCKIPPRTPHHSKLATLDTTALPQNKSMAYSTNQVSSTQENFTAMEQEDSCPSSPLSSPSRSDSFGIGDSPHTRSTRRRSIEREEDALYVPKAADRGSKRRRNHNDGDEAWTDEEEKPKRSKATSGPKFSKGKGKNKGKLECEGEKCTLCKNGAPYYLHKSMNPGWRETVLAVFEHFPRRITESEWKRQQGLSVDKSEEEQQAETKWLYFPDAYAFLEFHWDTLCPPQHRNRTFVGTNWRKTIQDTLSHNRTFFLSGKEIFGKTGFWRLSPKAPNAICANILSDNKQPVDYNINTLENSDYMPADFANCSFEQLINNNANPTSPIKEEKRDVALHQPIEATVIPAPKVAMAVPDFSKFDLLVAAIDHLENMKEDDN